MYIRELKNRSGSISIQIINKAYGKYKVLKTIGCATTWQKIIELKIRAKQDIESLKGRLSLFTSDDDNLIENLIFSLTNSSIRTIGHELIFDKIYDYISFGSINKDMFRHLVISRFAFPLSKLKTIDYLYRYQNVVIDAVYQFLGKLKD